MKELNTSANEAAVKRAIMRVNPEYFSWTVEAQERYRVTMPEADMFRLEQELLKTLFHIQVKTKEEMEKVFDFFGDEEYLLFNSAMLSVTGIGDDHFVLNEYLGDRTILDFDTLYDYDYDDHCFQEEARHQDMPGYEMQPYRGALYFRWARLRIDGVFHYATLSCMSGYLLGIIEEVGSDKIDELIPHAYVDGPHHGQRDGKGFIYDKRIDAAGQEAQLQELMDRFYRYTSERHQTLADSFDRKGLRRVYLLARGSAHELQMDFVFSEKRALQAVRFRHFLKDCRQIQGEAAEVEAFIEEERSAVLDYLERMHEDILHNFDSRVIKMRQKRKIILASDTLRDLF